MDFTLKITYPYVSAASIGNELTNIQAVNVRYGRQKLLDTFSASTAIISGRRPDLLPTINVNDGIFIQYLNDLGVPSSGFRGVFRVTDYRVDYGITSAEDTWQITCEDAIAQLGRSYQNVTLTAGNSTGLAASTASATAGITMSYAGSGSNVSAQTLTNVNVLDVVNQILRTEQGTMYTAQETIDTIAFSGRNQDQGFNLLKFTDGTIGTGQKYDRLTFAGIAENYATKVVTEPAGLAIQSSGTGTRVVTVDTYDQTTNQALALAQWLDGALDRAAASPTEISCKTETMTDVYPVSLFGFTGIGVPIGFRSTTYNVLTNGGIMSITPSDARITYHVIGADVTNYLVLNNTVFGKLDQNRLGF
jgi:uncharacterized lipoprotein YajG